MLGAPELLADAEKQTGLSDFGDDSFREALDRLVESLVAEAELTVSGAQILQVRIGSLLANRLRVHDVHRNHPEIGAEEVEGPLVIIGLPRTGTTALSQLLALDPQVRSLRLWESSDPVPPPERDTEDDDPRIAAAEQGLAAMYAAFPRMASLYHQTATGPTECQDLLGMEFRTEHFDGMAHVPSYTRWVLDCDMLPAYRWHRRVLQLLQWHCPPRLWHLKTPVHALALPSLSAVYPGARFLWTHRDPAQVLGSVCSLIAYTRSWVSDRDDRAELGPQQLDVWSEAMRRAMSYRATAGEGRFADIDFVRLNADPIDTVERAYASLGLAMSGEARRRMTQWAQQNPAGARGTHDYDLDDFGLDAASVRRRFGSYLERFDVRLG